MIINGNLYLQDCKNLTSLSKLKRVEGDLSCPDNIEDLGDLEYVGGSLFLYDCTNLKSLGKLKEVKRYLSCPNEMEDLGDLEYVGYDLDLRYCENLKSLGNLKVVKSNIYLKDSGITEEYIKENYPHLLNKCKW